MAGQFRERHKWLISSKVSNWEVRLEWCEAARQGNCNVAWNPGQAVEAVLMQNTDCPIGVTHRSRLLLACDLGQVTG